MCSAPRRPERGSTLLFVSAREKLSDADAVTTGGDRVYTIVDPPDRDLVITERNINELHQATQGKRVLVLVHGYNNEFSSVVRSYFTIEHLVALHAAGLYDVLMGYLWPGGDCQVEWAAAKRNADRVAQRFRNLVTRLADGAASLDVMTHSLGARVALKGLSTVDANRPVVRNLWLTAPAVDHECLERGRSLAHAPAACQQVFIFHSRLDDVLLAYSVVERHNALGLNGPQDPCAVPGNVKSVNCKRVVFSHGGYKNTPELFRFMAAVATGTDPSFFAIHPSPRDGAAFGDGLVVTAR